MFYSPIVLFMMVVFIVSIAILFIVVQIGLITYAFEKVGVPASALFALLLLSWFGSWINIPLLRLHHPAPMHDAIVVRFFGQHYTVPRPRRVQETILAINVGGAIIPTLLSAYLFFQSIAPLRLSIAIALVTAITYKLAQPVKGVGIAIPLFIPPLTAALLALLLVPQQAPLTAYTAGTIGTLVGADLLNLRKASNLGAPVMSIGGAGTFDGVFLTGIIAVLLA
jgi:uncharacterized membrane protein